MWKEVMQAKYLNGYRIMVTFNDGTHKVVDFTSLINTYPVFKPLEEMSLFKSFIVTDTLEWKNGLIDIAPEYLYENGLPA